MFRDWKSLLGAMRLMNKKQEYMENMLALLLLADAVAMLVGEQVRDALYGGAEASADAEQTTSSGASARQGKKWKRYSGLFILLKQKWSLPQERWWQVLSDALHLFTTLVLPPVPTHVRT